jgi:uncharacterized protein (DUF362 family)/Pyruvate/2-oxoacid:ferredoxin oxidoreductase delta subunit
MPKVIVNKSTYNYEELKPQIFSMLDSFVGDIVTKDKVVVIKPNFLAPAAPETAILTHPLVVRAAAEYVLEKGARPVISDSQAIGSFSRILKTGGFAQSLEGLDVEFREFKRSVLVDIGEPFGKVDIAADALEADVLINLPKLKTHCQMFLTLGVKNLFGCIVGLRKPEWHLRAGVDRDMFARLLVQIHSVVKPSVTILDGILAMQGQGPGRSGKPRELNVLMASDNAVALDMAVCRMFGLDPEELPTNRMAARMGLVPEYEIEGQLPQIDDFRLPLMIPLVFGPRRFHKFLREYVTQRPSVKISLCRSCGECSKYCPALAIKPEKSYVVFDYDKCIRCYCCVEVCPHGALETKETLLGKAFRRLIKS